MESELSFSAADLAQTRFAVSPMWEVVTSYRLLRDPAASPLHHRWAAQVRPRVAAAGLDRGWLAELVPAQGYLADFLNPTPGRPFPELSAELAQIRQSRPERVRTELDMLTAGRTAGRTVGQTAGQTGSRTGSPDGVPGSTARLRLLREAPEQALAKVTEEIEAYWELALAPYWSRVRRLLEADVFHRARQVAEHGSAHVLNELHESVRWDAGTLTLLRRHCSLGRDQAGAGLLLVPSVFTWPRVLTRITPPDPPQLAYPARGVGTLWEPRRTDAAEAVAGVLGRSRALLLAELDTPASTTRLALLCGLSAAGVSQHLTALRAARLVTAHRSGRSVLYARTAIADALLGVQPESIASPP
ncbi:transcriptional regulator [Streptomyces venezuelae]|uniref:Transcriptional regulator n=1 Tax=Streptomyces venezuelae TaxID=54571 RepID=A0A5P2D1M6_STRVZ|nr:transcriptional regulator [Streptomyces venezuelae]